MCNEHEPARFLRPGERAIRLGGPRAANSNIGPSRHWTCLDCQRDWPPLFMLHDDVWLSVAKRDELLCLPCTEKRLGRKVIPEDLAPGRVREELFLGHTIFKRGEQMMAVEFKPVDRQKFREYGLFCLGHALPALRLHMTESEFNQIAEQAGVIVREQKFDGLTVYVLALAAAGVDARFSRKFAAYKGSMHMKATIQLLPDPPFDLHSREVQEAVSALAPAVASFELVLEAAEFGVAAKDDRSTGERSPERDKAKLAVDEAIQLFKRLVTAMKEESGG